MSIHGGKLCAEITDHGEIVEGAQSEQAHTHEREPCRGHLPPSTTLLDSTPEEYLRWVQHGEGYLASQRVVGAYVAILGAIVARMKGCRPLSI